MCERVFLDYERRELAHLQVEQEENEKTSVPKRMSQGIRPRLPMAKGEDKARTFKMLKS